MKRPKKSKPAQAAVFEAGPDAVYTIEVIGELSGMSSHTILELRERGLVSPVGAGRAGRPRFDDEALRTLRRIEHLRTHYEMNIRSLRLTLGLLDEVERLRAGLRVLR